MRGWINYLKIGNIKIFLGEFGQWLYHKIRCILSSNGKE
ncbi:group II intron maturase-specific domain-containing protein [Coprobacillus cateniformis]